MNTIINTSPYMDNQRKFPTDAELLSREVDRAYVESAQAINERTIGLYPRNRPAVTGNSWYFTSQRKQSLRQLYQIDSFSNKPHMIDYATVEYFAGCFGSYTDGTNWYGMQFMTNNTIASQVTFYLDDTNIIFNVDGSEPAITKGIIVLEWIINI